MSLFLDSKYGPDADIKRFLKAKFASIQRRTGISDPSWPGKEVLDCLVQMSSGQFIVPVTIIRWVNSGPPRRQLNDVLQLEWVDAGQKNPFETLDMLYYHILSRANNPVDDPRLVVKWIAFINSAGKRQWYPLRPKPTPARLWRQILEDEEGEFSYRFAPIASLISIPPLDEKPVTMYHKTLNDFLSSPVRCGDLFVDTTMYDSLASARLLAILKSQFSPFISLFNVVRSCTC
jgi:hypothetical protein